MLGDLVSVNQELREYHYWKTLGHPGATEELFHELTEKKKLIEEQHRRLKKGVKEIHTKVEERKKVIAQQEDEKTLASFYEENVEDGFLSFDKVLVQEKAEQPAKTDAQRARARRKQAAAKKRRKAALQRTVAEQEATAALEDLSITQ